MENIKAAIAVECSENQKTGLVSATMSSQASCPKKCKLRKSGCYAESGPQGIHTARLNKSPETSPEAIARQEAAAISKLSGKLPLRLHVVGDCPTSESAEIVSAAVANYPQPVWSYTHAWRDVNRTSWGRVSVLASCESTDDVKRARAAGYATALVVDHFDSTKAYQVDGVKVVPCPNQTHADVQCIDCKLCWDDSKLKAIGATIAFEVHGSGKKKASAALIQIGGAN